MSATTAQAMLSRKDILQSILSSTQSYPKRPTKSTSASESPLPPPPSSSLSSPEDITASLISHGLEFKAARAVSAAYLDNAVQLQLHSQSRLQTNQHQIALTRSRLSSRLSAHKDIAKLQGKLRKVHDRVYRKDLKVILKKTISLAKSRLQAAQLSQQRMDESEDDPANASDDEDAAGADGPTNADDEKALQEMSARSSVLLSLIYERGHTFPRRYEKIKLAEETGLTYRQIGIWFSNRRERNRPGRERGGNGNRGGSTPTSAPTNRAGASRRGATTTIRESTAESTTENGHSPSSAITVSSSLVAVPSQDLLEDDQDCRATPVDEGDIWEEDARIPNAGEGELGRVPSLSNSVTTLDSLRSTSSSSFYGNETADPNLFNLLNPVVSIQPQTSDVGAQSTLTFDFGTLGNLTNDVNMPDLSFLANLDTNTAALPHPHALPISMAPGQLFPTLDASGFNAHDPLPLLPTASSSNVPTNTTANLNLTFAPTPSFNILTDNTTASPMTSTDHPLAFLQNALGDTGHRQTWSTMNSDIQIPLSGPSQMQSWQAYGGQYSFNMPMNDMSVAGPSSQASSSRPLVATRSMPALPTNRSGARSSRSPGASSSSNVRPTASGVTRRKTPIAIAPGPVSQSSTASTAAATAIAKRPMKSIPTPRIATKAGAQPRPIMAAPPQMTANLHAMGPTPSGSLKRTASEALGEGISALERRPLRC